MSKKNEFKELIDDLKTLYQSSENVIKHNTGFGEMAYKKFYGTIYSENNQYNLGDEIPEDDNPNKVFLIDMASGKKAGILKRNYLTHSIKNGKITIQTTSGENINFKYAA